MRTLIGLAMLLLPCQLLLAADPLLKIDFETSLGPITSGDPAAELSLTTDAGSVRSGESALKLTFEQVPAADGGQPVMPGSLLLQLPAPPPGIAGLSFSIKPERSMPLALLMGEGDGGPRYVAILWCMGGEWNDVELGLDDLAYDSDGPEDPSGKLDPESISGLMMFDLSGFILAGAQQMPMFAVPPVGTQTYCLDDLALLSEAPAKREMPDGETLLSDFKVPLNGMIIMGGKDFKITSEPMEDDLHAARLSYELPTQTILLLSHPLKPGELVGAQTIKLSIWTEQSMALMVGVDEKNPGQVEGDKSTASYNKLLEVPGGEDWQDLEIQLSDLVLGDDSVDPDGQLTLERAASIHIGDMTAVTQGQTSSRVLVIDDLIAAK